MTDYSQQNEQQHILAAFEGWKVGRYLDIGSYHPTALSNTRALYELGWEGVLIEPSPQPMLDLLAAYGEDQLITLVLGAVVCEPGLVKLFVTNDAVSTLSDRVYETWKDHTKFLGTMQTPGIPLEYISLRFGHFDFINIDAEGTSVDLFLKMMQLQWEPRAICCEHDSRESEVIQAATARGYHITAGNSTNLVMVRG